MRLTHNNAEAILAGPLALAFLLVPNRRVSCQLFRDSEQKRMNLFMTATLTCRLQWLDSNMTDP